MATQSVDDVVNQTQSVGDLAPSDAPATTPNDHTSGGEANEGVLSKESRSSEYATQVLSKNERNTGAGVENVPNGLSSKPESINGDATASSATIDPIDSRPSSSLEREEGMLEDGARSDTDTSRAEGSVTEDSKNLESLKTTRKPSLKPVSFAKYSVTKSIPTGTAVKTPADKVTTPSSSASSFLQAGRPRLVAKTASTLQQKAQPFKSAAPDPMQVWNKNRITPQPSHKNLTDEELKLQYGIHMTSRLTGDGEGKEAKWADIDDDEDDWAPETIEWTDGTKSTLNPADVVPPPVPVTMAVEPEATDRATPVQPSKILTSQFSSSVGPNATVLKVGGGAGRQVSQIPVQQQRGLNEKPLASASQTAPAPMPAKSPWAALPPVDKVSPVVINPNLAMPPPQRYPSSQGYFPNQSAPSPAKEISADDFNRNWRDSTSGQPRELYMPNSGRYEAVPENRRRMSKHDGNFRAPAVLQRPTDPHAPAEPSAAFQTHRNSSDTARRRASSTVSGGSGQFARRMSTAKSTEGNQVPLESIQSRRDSQVIRPESRDGPPSQSQDPTYQARGPSPSSYGFPQGQATGQGQGPEDLEVERARQKVLMREKIELARKRKEEEEQRLEAEKQERIKLRLAALGPAPEKPKKAEDIITEAPSLAVKEPLHSVQSPPKPPIPQESGAPQQYGMMKVHPMNSIKKSNPAIQQAAAAHQPNDGRVGQQQNRQSDSQVLNDGSKISPPTVNGVRTASESQRDHLQENTSVVDRSPRVPKAISVGPEARSGWGDVRNEARSAQSANLWGPINNSNKALGNGTFDQGLAGYAPHDLSSRTSSTPQGWINGRTPVTDRSPQPQFVNQQLPDTRQQGLPPMLSPEQTLAANSEADSALPKSKPAPIGPPQSSKSAQNWHPSPNMPNANNGVAAWNSFHQVANHQERIETERVQRELATKREEEARSGVRSGPQYSFNETWKQVQLGDQAGQRAVTGVAQSSVPATPAFGTVGSLTGAEMTSKSMNGQPPRSSRFFPSTSDSRRAVTYSYLEVPRSPSPPPAEEYASHHPAFEGGFDRPVVHFPPEKITVKLPPLSTPFEATPQPAQPAEAMSWAAKVAQTPPPRAVSQPLVQNPSWQDRFNGLFGRDGAPKASSVTLPAPVVPVSSSSRELLDVLPSQLTASVSLPPREQVDPLKDAGKVTSKDVEDEEDLFEDRQTGDLPIVRTPIGESPSPYASARIPFRQPPLFVESYSIPPYMVSKWLENSAKHQLDEDDGSPIVIKLGGWMDAINRARPTKASSMNGSPRGRGQKSKSSSGPLGSKFNKNKGPKSRQTSETQTPSTPLKSRSQQPPAQGLQPSPAGQSGTQSPHSRGGESTASSSPAQPSGSNASGNPRPIRGATHGHRGGWHGKPKTQGQTQRQPQPQAAH